MSLLRPFSATDLFKCVRSRAGLRAHADLAARFNNIKCGVAVAESHAHWRSLDAWTETYSTQYYLQYLATWPDLFLVQEHPDGTLMGYGAWHDASTEP